MAEVQEGEEVRAGMPVVDVVNPKTMRVRARVNQADINELQVGQAVQIGLDAYPELSFDGRIAQISPLGVASTLSPKVRMFVALDRRRRLAPEPDARSDRLARRQAGARAGRARGAARCGRDRWRARVRARAARVVFRRSAGHRRRDERARGGRWPRASTKARSSPETSPRQPRARRTAQPRGRQQ